MIVATKDNLEEVAALAARDRAAGRDRLDVLVAPLKQVTLYMRLWEGVVGRVVGRAYYEEASGFERNVDIIEARTVSMVVVRISTYDVIEAVRRAILGGNHQRSAPLRVHQIRPLSGFSMKR